MSKGAIIHRSTGRWQGASWQQAWQTAFTDAAELCAYLELDPAQLPLPPADIKVWQLRVPREFAAKMEKGNPADPLLRQVLPLRNELEQQAGYSADPLQEQAQSPTPGLIHKYRGRVLLIASQACAVHCRYCFRREFDYPAHRQSRAQWQDALTRIREDDSIEEVILSGGDPLSLDDDYLRWLCEEICAIGHVQRLRWHTRVPVVIPQRVTDALLQLINDLGLPLVIVLHANHAQELGDDVALAARSLASAGATLLNQSVLLADVNDSAAALIMLSKRLFALGILPYYLHLQDPVVGTAHFAVDHARGQQLVGQIAAELSGYLVPKLVKEYPNQPAKTPILPTVYK